MSDKIDTNPSNAPSTVTSKPVPDTPAGDLADHAETPEARRMERAADRLAHKAAKDEQNFDKDNSNLFDK